MASSTTRKCWLTFEGGCQKQPCLWRMAHDHPEVVFDIRQASVKSDIGVMAVLFTGDDDEIDAALATLTDAGVHVDPVEGGSLVEG